MQNVFRGEALSPTREIFTELGCLLFGLPIPSSHGFEDPTVELPYDNVKQYPTLRAAVCLKPDKEIEVTFFSDQKDEPFIRVEFKDGIITLTYDQSDFSLKLLTYIRKHFKPL